MKFEHVKNTDELKWLLESFFTDEFMLENTNFESYKAFRYSSAVFVNWNAEELIYDAENLDNFVKESTKFSSWNEMVHAGVDKKLSNDMKA